MSVYDSLVRMAQDFSLRYPLVDGQGNFGSIDGDSAAAYRYTEARLAPIAAELLVDLEKNTVDFGDNYSATRQEPLVLPARLPNLMLNGSSGIAVGMTTNIPPHNLAEVCDAEIYLIDHPDATTEDLMKLVKGPDFPTGGIIIGREGIAAAYGTGHGRLIVRARHTFEEAKNGRERIIITEIPYMVNKATLVARIADLVGERKLEGIADLNDESDRHGMRIVIELKKDARALTVLNNLYKHTALQTTFGVISLALVEGRPVVLNLKALLQHHIDHRRDVLTRRTRYELERARDRAHLLEGHRRHAVGPPHPPRAQQGHGGVRGGHQADRLSRGSPAARGEDHAADQGRPGRSEEEVRRCPPNHAGLPGLCRAQRGRPGAQGGRGRHAHPPGLCQAGAGHDLPA